jgi:tetratricopeptide (TPR) repeat protein
MPRKKKPNFFRNAVLASSCAALLNSGCAYPRLNDIKPLPKNYVEQFIGKIKANNYQSRYNTVAHKILSMGKETEGLDYKILDQIIDEVKSRWQPVEKFDEKQATSALKLIDRILTKSGFRYKKTEFLYEGLGLRENRKRYLDCDTYSAIYLGIAEAIGLQLKAVHVPGHMFVRWHNDDSTYFNWETTAGMKMTDKEYRNWIPPEEGDTLYLKSLSTTGLLLHTCKVLESTQKLEPGCCEKIIAEAEPNDSYNWHQLGLSMWGKNEHEKATEYLEKSIAIKPTSIVYHNLGFVWLERGDTAKAINNFKMALWYSDLEITKGCKNCNFDFERAYGKLEELLKRTESKGKTTTIKVEPVTLPK